MAKQPKKWQGHATVKMNSNFIHVIFISFASDKNKFGNIRRNFVQKKHLTYINSSKQQYISLTSG